MNGRQELTWSPRLSKAKLRQLYQSDAGGLLDLDLLEEVGFCLLQRCRDILAISEAKQGRVACPRCAREGRQTTIQRQPVSSPDPRDEVICCSQCSWQITWGEYSLSHKRRQLNPGGAVDVFRRYAEKYPQASLPQHKMLLIDQLIHEFHRSLVHPTGRPVGVNLIQGQLTDVVPFLDQLTYANHLPPEILEQRRKWREEMQTTYWADLVRQDEGSIE